MLLLLTHAVCILAEEELEDGDCRELVRLYESTASYLMHVGKETRGVRIRVIWLDPDFEKSRIRISYRVRIEQEVCSVFEKNRQIRILVLVQIRIRFKKKLN